MNIKQIEAEWEALDKSHLTGSFNEFYFKAEFAEKYFPKLIAVAMAALALKKMGDVSDDYWQLRANYDEALTNLENDE